MENQLNASTMEKVKAKLILEGANGPTDETADKYFEEHGIEVLPDVMSNVGGVVGSYFEWVQNKNAVTWSAEQVDRELNRHMVVAAQRTLERRNELNCSLRTAAFASALDHIGDVYKVRGIFP